MTTLDDKLIGIPSENYCSSDSDDNQEGLDHDLFDKDKCSRDTGSNMDRELVSSPSHSSSRWSIGNERLNLDNRANQAVNTGPKGVMEDRRRYMEMCRIKSAADRASIIADMKRMTLLNPSESASSNITPVNEGDEDLFQKYCAVRIDELRHKFDRLPTFGNVAELNADNFTIAIDSEKPDTLLLVHIYVDRNVACDAVNAAFTSLAKKYLRTKFCRFKAESGVISETFRQKGCPSIVAYQAGKVKANLVCICR